jgi:hypothetical protein
MKYIIITKNSFKQCLENGLMDPTHLVLNHDGKEYDVEELEDFFVFKDDPTTKKDEYVLLRIDYPFEYVTNQCSGDFFKRAVDKEYRENGTMVVKYDVVETFTVY